MPGASRPVCVHPSLASRNAEPTLPPGKRSAAEQGWFSQITNTSQHPPALGMLVMARRGVWQ